MVFNLESFFGTLQPVSAEIIHGEIPSVEDYDTILCQLLNREDRKDNYDPWDYLWDVKTENANDMFEEIRENPSCSDEPSLEEYREYLLKD